MGMREKLIELVGNMRRKITAWHTAGDIADHLIANDVVPVVRCKDCKSWEQYNACDGTKPHRCMNHDAIFYKRTNPDDFCSYGERKDNE